MKVKYVVKTKTLTGLLNFTNFMADRDHSEPGHICVPKNAKCDNTNEEWPFSVEYDLDEFYMDSKVIPTMRIQHHDMSQEEIDDIAFLLFIRFENTEDKNKFGKHLTERLANNQLFKAGAIVVKYMYDEDTVYIAYNSSVYPSRIHRIIENENKFACA